MALQVRFAISKHSFLKGQNFTREISNFGKGQGQGENNIPITVIFFWLTIDLGLPNGVRNSPESGHDVEDVPFVWMGTPIEEDRNYGKVDDCAEKKDGHPPYFLYDEAEAEGTDRIACAVSH